MRLLLDTHIFLWCTKNDRRLSKSARSIIQSASEIYISSASIWEASIKMKLGKLDVDIDDLVNAIDESGFLHLSISARHAATVSELPNHHRDPFDRILIAQAISEPLRLITSDSALQHYSDLVEIV